MIHHDSLRRKMSPLERLAIHADLSSSRVEQKISSLKEKASGTTAPLPHWIVLHAKIHQQLEEAIAQNGQTTFSESVKEAFEHSKEAMERITQKIGSEDLSKAHAILGLKNPQQLNKTMLPPVDPTLADIDANLLAYIHGDSFIKSSVFDEGGNHLTNTAYLLKYLKQDKHSHTKVAQMVPLFENMLAEIHNYKAAYEPHNHFIFSYQAKEHAKKLSEKVANLPAGEKFLMPGGWQTAESGHAMFYVIEKNLNGSYSFTIVNTGGGLNHHTSVESGYKTKYRPIYRVTDIDLDHMSNSQFFECLLELFLQDDSKDKKFANGPEDIYGRAASALRGKRDVAFENQVEFITDQRSGSCSWKSIMKVLQIETGDQNEYKHFDFDLRKDSLRAFFDKEPANDVEWQLMKRSAESFSRLTKKLFKAKIISKNELITAENLAAAVRSKVLEREKSLKAAGTYAIDAIQTTPYEGTFSTKILSQKPDLNPPEMMELHEAIPPLVYPERPETLDALNHMLSSVHEECLSCYKAGSHLAGIRNLTEMVKLFPSDSFKEGGYLDAITQGQSDEEIGKAMNSLYHCSKMLFSHISQLPREESQNPDYLAVMHILTGLNLRLSSRFSNDLQINIQPWVWRHLSHFIIIDKDIQKLYYHCTSYVQDKTTNNLPSTISFTKDGKLKNDKLSFDSDVGLNLPFFFAKSKEKIINALPHLKDKTDKEILEEVLPRMDEDLLSPCYRALFRHERLVDALEAHYILEGCNANREGLPGEVTVSLSKSKRENSLDFDVLFGGVAFNDLEGEDDISDLKNAQKFTAFQTPIDHPGLREILKLIPSKEGIFREDMGLAENIIGWSQMPSQALCTKAVPGISEKQTQDLTYMLSKRVQLIPSFLTYLKTYPESILERDHQLLLYHALFVGNTFSMSLECYPAMGEKLANELKKQLKTTTNCGNIEAQYFIIELISQLPNDLISGDEVRSLIRQTIESIPDTGINNKRLRALGFAKLIASYKDHTWFTDEEAKEIGFAQFYQKAFGYDKHLSHPYIRFAGREVLTRLNCLGGLSNPKVQRELMDLVSEKILGNSKGDWEKKGLIFYDRSHKLKINLANFTAYKDSILVGSLPEKMISQKSFQEFFGNRVIYSQEIAEGLYLLQVGEGEQKESYQICFTNNEAKKNERFTIQKQFGKEWRTFITHEELCTLPAGLRKGCRHFAKAIDAESVEILIESSKDGMAIAQVDIKGDSFTCKKLGQDEGFILQNTCKNPLSHFQAQGLILNWDNSLIEFPAAKIHFKKNKDNEFVYSKDSGFHLAGNQQPPTDLPLYQGWIASENDKGEKLYLLPKEAVDLDVLKKGALNRVVAPKHRLSGGQFLEIWEKDGVLKGKTPEENLYLAYLHLAHKNYSEAFKLLSQHLSGHPLGYTATHEEIIKWILDMVNKSEDPSPEACAVLLKLSSLILKNAKKDSALLNLLKGDADNPPLVLKALLAYYPIARKLKSLPLTPAEEVDLIQFVGPDQMPSAIQERYREIVELSAAHNKLPVNLKRSKAPAKVPPSTPKFGQFKKDTWVEALNEAKKNTGPLFYQQGGRVLATNLDDWITQVASTDPKEREMAVVNLGLLRMPTEEEAELRPASLWLKNKLVLIATQFSNEERAKFLEDWNQPVEIKVTQKRSLASAPRLQSTIRPTTASRPGRKLGQPKAKDEPEKKMGPRSFEQKLLFLHEFNPVEREPAPEEESTLVQPGVKERTNPAAGSEKVKKKTEQNAPSLAPSWGFAPDSANITEFLHDRAIDLTEKQVSSLGNLDSVLEYKLNAGPQDSKVVRAEFNRVKASIQLHRAKLHKTYRYDLAIDQVKAINKLVSEERDLVRLDADLCKEQILALANQVPEDPLEAAKHSLQIHGLKNREISIEDLIIFYLQDNGQALIKRNPYLNQPDVDLIISLLNQYLLQSTEADFLSRLVDLSEKAMDAPEAEFRDACFNLDLGLRESRSYMDPQKNKTLLIFEYFSGMRLRRKQFRLIQKMATADIHERKSLIAQLLMGSGKTKVILPLLAYLHSDGKCAPLIVVPDMLYETNLEDMRALSGSLLMQVSHTIQLDDGTSLTKEKLDEILLTIETVKKERSYCLIKSSTAHSLLLHFKEILLDMAAVPKGERPSADLVERYEKAKLVLNTLFQDGIIDEADMVLDCMKEVNFAIGAWTSLPEETKEVTEKIFLAIAGNPKLNAFFQLDKESETPFNKENYEKEIKPLLAEIVIQMAEADIPEGDKEAIALYLLASPTLKEIPPALLTLSPELKNQLALSKELINKLFPLALKKNANENFGLSKHSHFFKAIPYARSNTPSEGSEFSNPYETMVYTALYYSRHGVTASQIKELVKECKRQAISEHETDDTPLEETEGYKRFEKLQLTIEKNLFTIHDDDYEKAAAHFNSSIENKLRFAKEMGWSEIGAYQKKLTSTAQHLCGLFASLFGFTGTLWNEKTFPSNIETKAKAEDDGMTLSLLKNADSAVKSLEDAEALIQSLKGYHACIDAGAWFRGIPARDVAKKMLENLPAEISFVVYFNDTDHPPGTKGQAVFLQRGKENEDPKLLNQAAIPEKDRFTYYNITTGADIKQHPHAKAITTVGKGMLLRDLLQGVWRMRELNKKQKTDFAIPKEMETLGELSDLESIFTLCIHNQGKRQEEDNLRALKQKISYLSESAVLRVLKDPEISFEKAWELCQDAVPVLASAVSIDPFDLFGAIEEKKPIREVIDSYVDHTVSLLKPIYEKHPSLGTIEKLKEDISALIDFDILPEEESVANNSGNGTEVQVRKETKVEQKTEMQLLVEVVEDTRARRPSSRLKPLPLGNIFSSKYWDKNSIGINDLFEKKKDGLAPLDTEKKLFAEAITLTANMSQADSRGIIPFQQGSMPLGMAALQIYPDQSTRIVFLDPNEAEFVSQILDYDCEIRPDETTEKNLETWVQRKMEITIEAYKEAVKEKHSGKALEEFFKEAGKEYSEEALQTLYRDNLLTTTILDLCKVREPENLNQRLMAESIPLAWDGIKERCDGVKKVKTPVTIDQAKALFFEQKDFELVLVDPMNGFIKKGFDGKLIEGDILENPSYKEFTAQAKFYNGMVNNYTKEERQYLKGWILKNGVLEMRTLLSKILAKRPEDRTLFENNSPLKRVFLEAIQEENALPPPPVTAH